jgi:hypothetical protein
MPHTIIHNVYANLSFSNAVQKWLDFCPEIKHENQISTALSSCINMLGGSSQREVRSNGRRYDFIISNKFVEAKYHVEGDLIAIANTLRGLSSGAINASNVLKARYQTPQKDIVSEIRRGDTDYLIWYVCVRSNVKGPPFLLPKLISKFYSAKKCQSLHGATTNAQTEIDTVITPLIQQNRPCIAHSLPDIPANNGVLITRLYQFT